MEDLDLREILKDVPRGTKLYSTTHGDICFDCVDFSDNVYPIKCYEHCLNYVFTKEGKYHYNYNGECILFPSKEQRDWSKFCQLKIGDIIYNEQDNIVSIYNCDDLRFDVAYYINEKLFYVGDNLKRTLVKINISNCKLATNKEKELFYNELQKEGYFWNDETNFLEKYKFKVGDKIQNINSKNEYKIINIILDYYVLENSSYLKCSEQNKFETSKFDLNTLKPYDKVLVRYSDSSIWEPQLFSRLDTNLKNHDCKFVIIGFCSTPQCIPYEGNEHLAGTTNDCDEYYKTWE